MSKTIEATIYSQNTEEVEVGNSYLKVRSIVEGFDYSSRRLTYILSEKY